MTRMLVSAYLFLSGNLALAQANTALSNLASTAVNTDVFPDATTNYRSLGSVSKAWYVLYSQNSYFMNATSGDLAGTVGYVNGDVPSGNANGGLGIRGLGGSGDVSNPVAIYSTSHGSNTGTIYIESGNASGNSGDIQMRTGTASGTRGAIVMNARSLRVPTATSNPTAEEGSLYYNTSTHKLRIYDGTNWVDLNQSYSIVPGAID